MNVKLMNKFIPKIFIQNNVMNKINLVTETCNKEIAMLGFVRKENNNYYIYGAEIFKQEVHSTTAEITTEGLNEFAMELMKQENGVELWNDMKMWFHSHVNMGVNPSGQDDKQVETFESCGYDFFIRIICNKKGDVRLDLYDYTTGVIYQELGYEVYYSKEEQELRNSILSKITTLQKALTSRLALSNDEINDIKEEISLKVKEKTYGYNAYNGYYKGRNHNVETYSARTNVYYDWWDEAYGDGFKKKDEEISMREMVEEEAQQIFDDFSAPETFEAYIHIMGGGSVEEVIVEKTCKDVYDEIEELIIEYVNVHNDQYKEYLYGMEVE